MGRFQTFDWLIDKDEAFYFFRAMNIAHRFGSRVAVSKTVNDDATLLKLAIEYDSLDTIETFKELICHRMTFKNWRHLSNKHFLYESWIFVPNQHQPNEYSKLGQLLQDVARYPFGMPNAPDAIFFPYNLDLYPNEVKQVEKFIDSNDLIVEAQIPSVTQLKSAIQNFLSDNESVTYFEDKSYWDAKIILKQGIVFVEAIISENDNYILYGLRGDWSAAMSVMQQLANEFGSMVIDAFHSEWQSVIVNPTSDD